jgi:apolipoprotein N-acyltransferase
MVAFRAAENGIPIVWADAHGLSTIFDARGQAVAQAPVDRETSVFATVRLRSEKTLFTRAGDYFAYSSAGIAFALAVVILAKGAATRRARQDQGTTA